MTIQTVLTGAPVDAFQNLNTASATVIWQGQESGAFLKAFTVVNDHASQASTLTVSVFDGTTDKPLIWKRAIPADSDVSIELADTVHVNQGDEVRVTAGHANQLCVWAHLTRR